MNYKVFKKGNYLIIIDEDNNYLEESSADVIISKSLTSSTDYNFNLKRSEPIKNVPFANILDESGVAYASSAVWETFYTSNTGFNPATSASVATDIQNLADHVANTTTAHGLNLKAPLNSPTFTGTPLAPTATLGTNTTQIATTAFVIENAGGGSDSSPIWTKYTIEYTAFTAAATDESIELFSNVAKQKITGYDLRIVTAHAGTGITAATLEIGIVGTTDKHLEAFTSFATGDVQVLSTFTESYTGATSIKITSRVTGGNLSAGTAGSFEIYVRTEQLP